MRDLCDVPRSPRARATLAQLTSVSRSRRASGADRASRLSNNRSPVESSQTATRIIMHRGDEPTERGKRRRSPAKSRLSVARGTGHYAQRSDNTSRTASAEANSRFREFFADPSMILISQSVDRRQPQPIDTV